MVLLSINSEAGRLMVVVGLVFAIMTLASLDWMSSRLLCKKDLMFVELKTMMEIVRARIELMRIQRLIYRRPDGLSRYSRSHWLGGEASSISDDLTSS